MAKLNKHIQNPKQVKQCLIDIGNNLVSKKIISSFEISHTLGGIRYPVFKVEYFVKEQKFTLSFNFYFLKNIKEKDYCYVKNSNFSKTEVGFTSLNKNNLLFDITNQILQRVKGLESENLFEEVLKMLKQRSVIDSYKKSNTDENIAGVDWYVCVKTKIVPINIKASENGVSQNKHPNVLCIVFKDFEIKDVKEIGIKIKEFALAKQASN